MIGVGFHSRRRVCHHGRVPTPSRPSRREVAAAATREEILRTARRLFAENGFAATSVQAIAAEAGVAVQTIYSSVGSKGALVVALNDTIDAESGIMPVVGAAMASDDPHVVVRAMVRVPRLIGEVCGDLVAAIDEATPAHPDARAAGVEGRRRQRMGEEGLLRKLDALGALRAGLDVTETADVVSALTDTPTFVRLVDGFGWTWDRAEDALVAVLEQLLLVEVGR